MIKNKEMFDMFHNSCINYTHKIYSKTNKCIWFYGCNFIA